MSGVRLLDGCWQLHIRPRISAVLEGGPLLRAGATEHRLSILLGRSLTLMYCRPASFTSNVPREFFSPNPAAARVPITEGGMTPRGEPNAALTNHSSSVPVNWDSRGIAPAIINSLEGTFAINAARAATLEKKVASFDRSTQSC